MAQTDSYFDHLPFRIHDEPRGRSLRKAPSLPSPTVSCSPSGARSIHFDEAEAHDILQSQRCLEPLSFHPIRRSYRPPSPSPGPEPQQVQQRQTFKKRLSKQSLKIITKVSMTNTRGQPQTPPSSQTSPRSLDTIEESRQITHGPLTPSPSASSSTPQSPSFSFKRRPKFSLPALLRRSSSSNHPQISWPLDPPIPITRSNFPQALRESITTIPYRSSLNGSDADSFTTARPTTARSATAPTPALTPYSVGSSPQGEEGAFPYFRRALQRVRSHGPIIYGIPPPDPLIPAELDIATEEPITSVTQMAPPKLISVPPIKATRTAPTSSPQSLVSPNSPFSDSSTPVRSPRTRRPDTPTIPSSADRLIGLEHTPCPPLPSFKRLSKVKPLFDLEPHPSEIIPSGPSNLAPISEAMMLGALPPPLQSDGATLISGNGGLASGDVAHQPITTIEQSLIGGAQSWTFGTVGSEGIGGSASTAAPLATDNVRRPTIKSLYTLHAHRRSLRFPYRPGLANTSAHKRSVSLSALDVTESKGNPVRGGAKRGKGLTRERNDEGRIGMEARRGRDMAMVGSGRRRLRKRGQRVIREVEWI